MCPYIVSEIELTYKPAYKATCESLKTSSDFYEFLIAAWNPDTLELREEFKILLLNRNLKVLGLINAFAGGGGCVVADIRLILAAALKGNASSIVVAHNHPSGSLKPSRADIELTGRLKTAADLVGIDLLDHLIVTQTAFYSFSDDFAMM